jgi:hypothetical protein
VILPEATVQLVEVAVSVALTVIHHKLQLKVHCAAAAHATSSSNSSSRHVGHGRQVPDGLSLLLLSLLLLLLLLVA